MLRTVSVVVLFVMASPSAAFSAGGTAAPRKKKSAERKFPEFSVFTTELSAYFAGLPKYHAGDILSKTDVSGAFKVLKNLGWEVDDRKKIMAQILDDNAYMVKQLRSKKGRILMRDFSQYPHAYDRLDRFLQLPHGKKFFQGLLNGPDAYKMFEYMTTSQGGENLGIQISHAKKGRDFNKPTGRIYTAKALLERLSESHTLHVKLLKKQKEKQAADPEQKS